MCSSTKYISLSAYRFKGSRIRSYVCYLWETRVHVLVVSRKTKQLTVWLCSTGNTAWECLAFFFIRYVIYHIVRYAVFCIGSYKQKVNRHYV